MHDVNSNRTKTNIAVAASIIALAVSVFAICPSIPRLLSNDGLQFDYIGAIIGVLSILVTILLGWNIWSLIDSRRFENRVDKNLKNIEHNIDSQIIHLLKDRYEIFASIHKDFAHMAFENYKQNLNNANVYSIIRHLLFAVSSYQHISMFSDTNKLIDFLLINIPQQKYDIIEYENKKKLIEIVMTLPHRNKITKYDTLVSYVLGQRVHN